MKMNVNMPAFCMANISTNEDNISTRGYWGYFSMIIRSKFPRRSPVKTCSKRSTTEGRGLAREETENTIISNVNNVPTKKNEKNRIRRSMKHATSVRRFSPALTGRRPFLVEVWCIFTTRMGRSRMRVIGQRR